jgi:5-methylcytosine-specific restriction endonuclease McrA
MAQGLGADGLTKAQRYYRRHRDKVLAKHKELRQENPEKFRGWSKRYRENNPDSERARHLKREYNLTIEEYNAMSVQQGGVCAICKQPETQERNGVKYRLAVDHCHKTDKVRGLLCFKCNSAMGSFEKREVPLSNVEKYLETYRD